MTCTECRDAWVWRATYVDGSMLDECDGTGTHRVFADIIQEALSELAWLPLQAELPILAIDCIGKNLHYRLFRQRVLIMAMNGQSISWITFHCLGWEAETVKHYIFMDSHGMMFESDDINAATNSVAKQMEGLS